MTSPYSRFRSRIQMIRGGPCSTSHMGVISFRPNGLNLDASRKMRRLRAVVVQAHASRSPVARLSSRLCGIPLVRVTRTWLSGSSFLLRSILLMKKSFAPLRVRRYLIHRCRHRRLRRSARQDQPQRSPAQRWPKHKAPHLWLAVPELIPCRAQRRPRDVKAAGVSLA